jgi:hypothetical protein
MGGKVCKKRLVKECHLFGCRCLEYLPPLRQCIAFYGWILHAAALNPVEEDIRGRREIVQLNSSANSPRLILTGLRPAVGLDPPGITIPS